MQAQKESCFRNPNPPSPAPFPHPSSSVAFPPPAATSTYTNRRTPQTSAQLGKNQRNRTGATDRGCSLAQRAKGKRWLDWATFYGRLRDLRNLRTSGFLVVQPRQKKRSSGCGRLSFSLSVNEQLSWWISISILASISSFIKQLSSFATLPRANPLRTSTMTLSNPSTSASTSAVSSAILAQLTHIASTDEFQFYDEPSSSASPSTSTQPSGAYDWQVLKEAIKSRIVECLEHDFGAKTELQLHPASKLLEYVEEGGDVESAWMRCNEGLWARHRVKEVVGGGGEGVQGRAG